MKLPLFATAGLILLLAGCVTTPSRPALPVKRAVPVKKESFWRGDGVSGEASIVIDLGRQRVYFYRGTEIVGQSVISSGKTGFETPPGEYKVIQKDRNHESNLYGQFVSAEGEVIRSNVDMSKNRPPEGATFKGAKMPYFLRFHEGYGLHAGRVPGHPASHGCVRLPNETARHFFENADVGTPVILQN